MKGKVCLKNVSFSALQCKNSPRACANFLGAKVCVYSMLITAVSVERILHGQDTPLVCICVSWLPLSR